MSRYEQGCPMRRYTRLLASVLVASLGAGSPAESPTPTVAPAPTLAPSPSAQPSPAPAAAQPTTSLPPAGSAPDRPISVDSWVPGDKQGIGTAFTYDQPAGDANP